MLKSYFLSAWRNLVKNRTLSIINISGLSVGITFTLLIGLWIRKEISFDKFHADAERIGWVMKRTVNNDRKNTSGAVPLPLYDQFIATYPEIESMSRFGGELHHIRFDDRVFVKDGAYADPGFLQIFSFKMTSGDRATALNEPASIILTSSFAKALFGDEAAIGKSLRFDTKHDLVVTGVLEDIPVNSTLHFEYLIPYEFNILSNESVAKRRAWWGDNFVTNFVKVKPGVSLEEFGAKVTNVIRDVRNDQKEGTLFLHPATKWHLQNEFKDWVNTGGRIEYVRLFGFIGVLILVIACINFMNLATARSEKRVKEVGIRKAIGSRRHQIAGQFLGESLLTASISFVLSLVLANLLLPSMATLGFQGISLEEAVMADGVWLVLALFGACIATGLLAGSYPAIYLSSFIPVNALKGGMRAGRGAITTRRILVVTQFTFSIMLVISTLVVFRQIQHAKNRPLGYDPDNLIAIWATDDMKRNYAPMKQELLSTGFVEAVSKESSPMTAIFSAWRDFEWEGMDKENPPVLAVLMTEFDYEKTTRINIVEGRAFSPLHPSDSSAVLINESAVRLAGFKDPIGQTIYFGTDKLTVIGVLQDVVMVNPFNPVMPAIYMFNPDRVSDIMLRIEENTDVAAAIPAIQEIVEKYNPAYPFEYRFVRDEFNKKFETESHVGKLAGIFAGLAVFISCMGLFGLVAFMAEQRVKEIGIRKILGASVAHLWALLSTGFVKLVLISFALATPLAYLFLENWLEKYQYRTELSWWIFGIAGGAALVVTIITVSFQSIRAALSNPVKSLRSE